MYKSSLTEFEPYITCRIDLEDLRTDFLYLPYAFDNEAHVVCKLSVRITFKTPHQILLESGNYSCQKGVW